MPTFNAASPLRPYHIDDAINAGYQQTTLTSLQTVKSDLLSWIQSPTGLNRTFVCPGCLGAGRVAKSAYTGNPADTDLIIHDTGSDSDSCRGWGYTVTSQTLVGRTQTS